MAPSPARVTGRAGAVIRPRPPSPAMRLRTATARPQPIAIQFCGITKVFPGVVANDCVNLLVQQGEVHCLLGENGAGKSTLMNVLAGIYQPDEGSIRVGGEEVCITCPRDAIDLGIGMVHQHSSLIPTFTVLENLMLGQGEGVRLSVKKAQEGLARLSAMLGVEVDPDTEVGQLSLGQQQQVEILKALWQGSKVLILDEPTSMLTPQGIEDLERVLVQLKQRGPGHHLHHPQAARGPRHRRPHLRAASGPAGGHHRPRDDAERVSREELQRMIVGPDVPRRGREPGQRRRAARPRGAGRHGPQGELSGSRCWSSRTSPSPASTARSASRRASRSRCTPARWSASPASTATASDRWPRPLPASARCRGGDIRLGGTSMRKLSIGARQRLGLRYVTDDRFNEGIVGSLPVSINMVIKSIGMPPFWVHGRTRRRRSTPTPRSWWTSTTS